MPDATDDYRPHISTDCSTGEKPDSKSTTTIDISDDAELLATLISKNRAWYIIRTLVATDGPVQVDALARDIAEQTGLSQEMAYGSLHQTTLQSLDERNVIQYDSEEELVALGDRFDDLVSAKDELITALDSIDSPPAADEH